MPMPPTSKRNRSDGGKQERHDAAAAFGRFRDLTEIAHGEVIDVARLDAVAARERLGHCLHRRLNLRLIHGLDIDLVDETGETRLQIHRDSVAADKPS